MKRNIGAILFSVILISVITFPFFLVRSKP